MRRKHRAWRTNYRPTPRNGPLQSSRNAAPSGQRPIPRKRLGQSLWGRGPGERWATRLVGVRSAFISARRDWTRLGSVDLEIRLLRAPPRADLWPRAHPAAWVFLFGGARFGAWRGETRSSLACRGRAEEKKRCPAPLVGDKYSLRRRSMGRRVCLSTPHSSFSRPSCATTD